MSKQSRTPKQNAVGRWCTRRGCLAGAYLENTSQPVPATGWASVQPRAGESVFLPAQSPRQAMALLAGPGEGLSLPSPRYSASSLCVSLPGVKFSGAVVWEEADVPIYSFLILPEKLACTKLYRVWRIRAWTLKGWESEKKPPRRQGQLFL